MVDAKPGKSGFQRYIGLTFLIGFGFLTMGLMDPLYDTYVPLFLAEYIKSNMAVGGIMALDNILQLMLIPLISVWSDRTRTRLGRRMPFIIVMLPISAALFTLIPPLAAFSLPALIGIIFVFNIFKTSVRGPVVALMPDTIPGDYRSEANGVINMMGGIGLIVSTMVLAPLMEVRQGLPFNIASGGIIVAVLVLLIFVREKLPENPEEQEAKIPVWTSIKQIFSFKKSAGGMKGDPSAALILVSLFLWFAAYEGAKTFLGRFMVEAMGVSSGSAALAQGMAGISSVILAVPGGFLAHKMGRRRFIRFSLICLTLILLLIPLSNFITPLTKLGQDGALIVFLGLMFFYGAFWIGVVVNSFPMLWQMATFGTIGIYTGLYYLFSQSAAILSPPLTGAIIDLFGFPGMFVFAGLCMLAAWFTMGGVKSGEPGKIGL